jgi:deazaflavin-dependent oxidoreductase (nitroreductase family)
MGARLLNGIPRVDPARRTAWQRLASRLSGLMAFPAVSTFHRTVMAPIDQRIMGITKGRVSTGVGTPVVLLRTIGAKSGAPRDVTLAYFTDGDDIVLIASNYGQHHYPSWYHNLRKNPECELFARGHGGRFVARATTGEDHDRLYSIAESLYDNFRLYKASTADVRMIPVLRLTPVPV